MSEFYNYDAWKQTLPKEDEPIMNCDSCGTELYVGDYYFEISANERVCESCLERYYRKEIKDER